MEITNAHIFTSIYLGLTRADAQTTKDEWDSMAKRMEDWLKLSNRNLDEVYAESLDHLGSFADDTARQNAIVGMAVSLKDAVGMECFVDVVRAAGEAAGDAACAADTDPNEALLEAIFEATGMTIDDFECGYSDPEDEEDED